LEKAPDAFRTISEVADEIDVPQHVLRFWESRFPQIRPMKRGGGRRYYRPDDVDLLRGVRHLLYGAGYTSRGVQRILREQGVTFVQSVWSTSAEALPPGSDEDEEIEQGEDAETPVASRAEPNLFAVAAPRAPEPAPHSEGRREPTIVPTLSPEQPSPPVQPAPLSSLPAAPAPPASAPGAVSAADRRKLQAALDELIGCRRIIETALSAN
jgi:DNA-binding transcriptional MerR regulator